MSELKTIHVQYPAPHVERTQKMLKKYPEIQKLFGPTPSTAWIILGLVGLQVALAIALSQSSFLMILLTAYTIGACANHALFVTIHDCTHNLVFRGNTSNSLLQIFANFPIIFPSSISFRIYHMKHHLYQGVMDYDADLPRPFEVKWVGRSSLKKTIWYLFYFLWQLLRIPSMKDIRFITPWVILNFVTQITFLTLITLYSGWSALIYLGLSTAFSIGLHPLGARWIQEHYVIHPNQETYSYYGPLNTIALNVGYHNEHHDFMQVAWSRLPKIRELAPEFYDCLYSHQSWTKLLIRFIRDPQLGLFSRVTRDLPRNKRMKQEETIRQELMPC